LIIGESKGEESIMKKIKIENAVGRGLGHDVTQIIPAQYKGPRFKRGHLIQEEDIPEFLKIGKGHIYVMDSKPGILAGGVLRRREVSLLGHGGFCQNCDPCHFPICHPFGKG
jgi:hypothetical protein